MPHLDISNLVHPAVFEHTVIEGVLVGDTVDYKARFETKSQMFVAEA